MSVTIKSEKEIELMREAGRLLALVHEEMGQFIRPGVSTKEIDELGEKVIRSFGCEPNFLNYNGFPASVCVSVNDEVVHGKLSLMGRMPGDYWRQFAGDRLLLLYQMCHSGGKLTFMGTEIAPFIEWRYYEELEWFLLDYPTHAAHKNYVKALNHMYLEQPSLWQESYSQGGHQWLDADNNEQSILLFMRKGHSSAAEDA